jgi:flagellar biosynthesis regulator FlbT
MRTKYLLNKLEKIEKLTRDLNEEEFAKIMSVLHGVYKAKQILKQHKPVDDIEAAEEILENEHIRKKAQKVVEKNADYYGKFGGKK